MRVFSRSFNVALMLVADNTSVRGAVGGATPFPFGPRSGVCGTAGALFRFDPTSPPYPTPANIRRVRFCLGRGPPGSRPLTLPKTPHPNGLEKDHSFA